MIATVAARAATAIEAIENFFMDISSQGSGIRNSCVLIPGREKNTLIRLKLGGLVITM